MPPARPLRRWRAAATPLAEDAAPHDSIRPPIRRHRRRARLQQSWWRIPTPVNPARGEAAMNAKQQPESAVPQVPERPLGTGTVEVPREQLKKAANALASGARILQSLVRD